LVVETAATLPSARRRKALQRPQGRRGAGHIVAAACLQLVFYATCLSPVLAGRINENAV